MRLLIERLERAIAEGTYNYDGWTVGKIDPAHVKKANDKIAKDEIEHKRRLADPEDPLNKRSAAIEAAYPKWMKLEGEDVIGVPNPKSLLAAMPSTGKKNAKVFYVIPRNPPRKIMTTLDKSEVYLWLAKAFVDENEANLIRTAE